MRKTLTLLATAAAMLSAVPASAHSDMQFSGKVTAVNGQEVKVQVNESFVANVWLGKDTRITQDGKRVTAKDVKVGQTVKVDAFGDSLDDMDVLDVTIVQPTPRAG